MLCSPDLGSLLPHMAEAGGPSSQSCATTGPEVTAGAEEGSVLQSSLLIPDSDDDLHFVERGARSAAGADSGSTRDEDESKHLECCVLCSRSYKPCQLINTGCKVYVRYRCKPCHAAVRQLERSASSEGEERKEWLANYKKSSPEKFAHLVQMIRVKAADEPPAPKAVQSQVVSGMGRAESGAVIRKLITQVISTKGSKDYEEVMWATERQYKAYYRQHEDYSREEANEKWLKDSASGSGVARKQNRDNMLVLAIRLPERTQRYKDKQSKRIYEQVEDDPVEEDLEQESSLKRLRSHDGSWAMPEDVLLKASAGEPVAKKGPSSTSVRDTLVGMVPHSMSSAAAATVDGQKAVAYAVGHPGPEALKSMGLTKACPSQDPPEETFTH